MNFFEAAGIALRCLDLTSLGEKDNEQTVLKLCDRAVGKYGAVAAVCIWMDFIPAAKKALDKTGVKIATVVNFPKGEGNAALCVAETRKALNLGADEIDLVFPYRELLAGNRQTGKDIVRAVKDVCKDNTLKVIIETGVLQKAMYISHATKDAVAAGADFVKTSTGKTEISATLEAANAVLEAIRDSGRKGVGFKVSGGVKTVDQAKDYMTLASSIMGEGYLNPKTFRIGASSLLEDIARNLGF